MQPVLTIAIGLMTGAACAHYAKAQGRNPWRWFVIGFLFGLFGLLFIFILPRMKKRRVQPAPSPAPAVSAPVLPAPAQADKLWYYLDEENGQHGPMSYGVLKKAFEEKKISSETYVWNEDFIDWKQLKETMSVE